MDGRTTYDFPPRMLLGLPPRPRIYQMQFHELAALVYRDNIWQKHADQKRLHQELTNKKQPEEMERAKRRKALKDRSTEPSGLSMLMIEHLLAVP